MNIEFEQVHSGQKANQKLVRLMCKLLSRFPGSGPLALSGKIFMRPVVVFKQCFL
jgi:hypothetical protein